MTDKARRPGFAALLLLLAGCVFEPLPYPAWTPAPAPPPPLSVQDVVKLLKSGFGEEAILSKIWRDGLEARPTCEEISALKEAGASDRLIQALLSAPVPNLIDLSGEAPEGGAVCGPIPRPGL
ncbi:MAG: hypothetical protein HY293_13975 [Planctomycetes bacterium]|nr:hypothetical protein [Planctomycetota bacterium]